MFAVFSISSLHSIRSTAGKFLSCWAQTNPEGRPQHIWADCTRFTLGDPERVTTHRLHSPAHCYSNQRRQHTIRGGLWGSQHRQRKHRHRQKNLIHRYSQRSRNSLSLSYTQTNQINTYQTHTEGSSGDPLWSCCQAKDCCTMGRGGRTGKREVGHE